MESHYLLMRDSVQLAANLYLPKGLEPNKGIPTILYLTRYIRALEAADVIGWFNPYFYGTVEKEEIKFFTNKGYAVMVVDVRGTGASTGVRPMEFSDAEIHDGAEIVDWIITQPWSNGKVGANGVSYLATTAEMLLINHHPSVKAIVNRSGIFDLYHNITFPGGVRMGRFIEVWRNSTYALDNNKLGFFSAAAGLLVKGPMPVRGDKNRRILKAAEEDHKGNFDIFPPLEELTFRDEIVPELDQPIDAYSPHRKMDVIESSGTPIYRISGWLDGGNVNAAIQGYWAMQNSKKLLIGPWDHGAKEFISPFDGNRKVKFDILSEMLRFFDYYLYGIENGILEEPPINYYSMGKEEWRQTDQWPDPAFSYDTLYFSADHLLQADRDQWVEGHLQYHIDYDQTTGDGSRWNSLTPAFRYEKIGYPDWTRTCRDLHTFSTLPLKEERELTGHPLISLTMSADARDATVFVYLQDKAPDGSVTYITEGQFRAIHRKESGEEPPYPQIGPHHTFTRADSMPIEPDTPFQLRFDLLPTSYLLREGHQLQVAFAGVDIGHFDPPEDRPSKFQFLMEQPLHCFIELPLSEDLK